MAYGLALMSADGRPGDGPPVVQHLGDVDDPTGHLAHPERQVVVLGAVVALAEPADTAHDVGAHHRQVGGVHLAAQALGRPVGFAELVVEVAVVVDLVLVGVEVVDVVVLRDLPGVGGQRARRQQVVVVEQHDELAPGGVDAVVGRRDDVAVGLTLDQPDARVSGRVLADQLSDRLGR